MATPLALETPHTLTWQQRAIRHAVTLATTGKPFTFGKQHTPVIGKPDHHAAWGSIMRNPNVSKSVEHLGFIYSSETGGIVHLWRGCPLIAHQVLAQLDKEIEEMEAA